MITVTRLSEEEQQAKKLAWKSEEKKNRMDIDWTSYGEEYADSQKKKDAVLAEAHRAEWRALPGDGTLSAPMSQGMAIQAILDDKIARPLAVSWNGVLENRYCLIGARYQFADRVVNSYWLDTGTSISCLLTERVEDVQPS